MTWIDHMGDEGGIVGKPDLGSNASRALASVLRGAQAVTLAALRLTDSHGVVVASTGGDLGASLTAWREGTAVLAGAPIATTMHQREFAGPLLGGRKCTLDAAAHNAFFRTA